MPRQSTAYVLLLLSAAFSFVVLVPSIATFIGRGATVATIFLLFFRMSLFFVIFHIVGYWYYRVIGFGLPRVSSHFRPFSGAPARVAVLIPVRNEPTFLIQRMFQHLARVQYGNFDVYVIDNSTIPQMHVISALARDAKLVATIIRKSDSLGYKAGALNKALEHVPVDTKYVFVLDIDHAPDPQSLHRLVSVIEANPRLAFVQSPQTYTCQDDNLVSEAYCFKQRIFYDQICKGMVKSGALFISGTNVILRRRALEEIGGFDETSLTEDIRTTVLLYARGWEGEYFPEKVAVGYPPSDLHSLHRQQRRWAIGTYQNLFFCLHRFMAQPKALSIEQWLVFLGWNGTFYLQGATTLLFIVSSLLFVYSNFHAMLVLTDGIAFFAYMITFGALTITERRSSGKPWWRSLLYSAILFGNQMVYLSAMFELLIRKELQFEVTNKDANLKGKIPIAFLYYHAILTLILVLTLLFLPEKILFNSWVIVWPALFLLQSVSVMVITFNYFAVKSKLEERV